MDLFLFFCLILNKQWNLSLERLYDASANLFFFQIVFQFYLVPVPISTKFEYKQPSVNDHSFKVTKALNEQWLQLVLKILAASAFLQLPSGQFQLLFHLWNNWNNGLDSSSTKNHGQEDYKNNDSETCPSSMPQCSQTLFTKDYRWINPV